VIEQSSLGAALTVSRHRFIGTLLGAAVGAIVATLPVPRAVAFGGSVFLLGLLRVLSCSDLNGYRFGVATLAIILLVPRVARRGKWPGIGSSKSPSVLLSRSCWPWRGRRRSRLAARNYFHGPAYSKHASASMSAAGVIGGRRGRIRLSFCNN
jgi:Fusaric acid resistance protein-like